ncbi:hypothetical protein ANO11243_084390 [Dothideomycetidae sp. 11243]|nr:hypothetical protein ANO11243_084390 [fungal sp. No.11243]
MDPTSVAPALERDHVEACVDVVSIPGGLRYIAVPGGATPGHRRARRGDMGVDEAVAKQDCVEVHVEVTCEKVRVPA